jgi:hypothetical protein
MRVVLLFIPLAILTLRLCFFEYFQFPSALASLRTYFGDKILNPLFRKREWVGETDWRGVSWAHLCVRNR